MSEYRENPKMKGSGVLGCIPQKGTCPMRCEDCYFQSGRSFLEPLSENLPNCPSLDSVGWRIVRMNDGSDSSVQYETVVRTALDYKSFFFNTACPDDISGYPAPVVLTVNPGEKTDESFCHVAAYRDLKNLMFVRVRANAWNQDLVSQAVRYYTESNVPVVLTFMRYYKRDVPEEFQESYEFKQATTNTYWVPTLKLMRRIAERYRDNILVSTCGRISAHPESYRCRHCGVCLREYFATMERLVPFRDGDLK